MVHLILFVIFLSFALVQWNDSDFIIWMPVYLSLSAVALLAYNGRFYKNAYLVIAAILGLWMASYIPHMLDWVDDGMPDIAGSMKAESPYIELTREFFGLLICFAAICYYYILSKRKNTNYG